MAFLDFLKKGRQEKKRMEKPVKKEVQKPKAELKKPVVPKRKGTVKTAPQVLIAPQITEKATQLQNKNDYVFKVDSRATKPQIKKSVEEVYNVKVGGVRIINVPRKSKRLGRTRGWKQGYKKAVVSVKKGQTIEVLPR